MFINLRVHSSYSLAESAIKILDLLSFCKKHDTPACAITDNSNLFGAMEFCLNAVQDGIQPIIGAKINVVSPIIEQLTYYPLIFLVTSKVGYQNLSKIISRAYLENDHDICTTFEQISSLNEGLIVLTAGMEGEIAQHLLKNDHSSAKKYINLLQEIYKNNLYIELQRFNIPNEEKIEDCLLDFAQAKNIPVVATNTAYFIKPEQFEAHDVLMCISSGTYVSDPNRKILTPEYRLKTPQEMENLFVDLPEAIENTVNIAKKCHFILTPEKPILPKFETPKGEKAELDYKAKIGLEKRLKEQLFTKNHTAEEKEKIQEKYFNRLNFELSTIHKMGYAGYFLIVAEFIQWAKIIIFLWVPVVVLVVVQLLLGPLL